MNTCKTCKYWFVKESVYNKFVNERNDYYDKSLTDCEWEVNFDIRYCNRVIENEELKNDNDFGVHDGSDYMARLYTAENFGCISWEAK